MQKSKRFKKGRCIVQCNSQAHGHKWSCFPGPLPGLKVCGENTFIGGKICCFYCIFKSFFSKDHKIRGTKNSGSLHPNATRS